MEKRTKAVGKQAGSSQLSVYRILLEQRAATDELRASTQELEAILEQLVDSQPTLRPIYQSSPTPEIQEAPSPAARRKTEPADQSIAKLQREADEDLRKGREAILESMRLRLRSQRVREALAVTSPRRGKAPVKDKLSARERQVLTLIVKGKSSKEIAAELGISFKTAVTHRTSIMSKLDVHEIASVVREAILRGLV
jgi:DNA-binding CsgD family transcriptional regulator